MDNETITAMATAMGTSGIGIIRISGDRAVDVAGPLFKIAPASLSAKEGSLKDLPSRKLTLGFIIDPVEDRVVDEVMVVVMRAPNSYTREDVVEIQSHSGHVLMATILNLILDQGARLAEPGEFTKRAFLNGRIDLSQAEAVADTISARSDGALKLATTHLAGHMRATIDSLLDIIADIQVELEACIEFPEETVESLPLEPIKNRLQADVLEPVESLVKHYRDGHFLRDGIRVGIVGRPNVGKSSLLNRILLKDKAIVTPTPGTTRDLIEDQTCIEGVPVLITDTAGLRASTDPVEIVGIERAQKSIETSDILLLVVDAAQGLIDDDIAVYEQVKHNRFILCVNKIDLLEKGEAPDLDRVSDSGEVVFISAKTGEGLLRLKQSIKEKCLKDVKIEPGRSIVPNQRQKIALQGAAADLDRAISGLERGVTEELIISDLNQAKASLGSIVGQTIDSDILDDIFNRFCIGK